MAKSVRDAMTEDPRSIAASASVVEAARLMREEHIGSLPITDDKQLVGMITDRDITMRVVAEAADAKMTSVGDVYSRDLISVEPDEDLQEALQLMARHQVRRLPVVENDRLVGIVSRANLLQAVAGLAREIPDPTADDDHIRSRVIAAIEKNDWSPFGLNVIVRDGIVHLSGVITEERSRQASMVAAQNVAGVQKVHDHLCWVDTMSGMYLESPEDVEVARAG
jgi:CBS domain-containing protein